MLLLPKIGCFLHLLKVQCGVPTSLNLNSAANSGKNHKDILKKQVGDVLFRADKTCFLFNKKKIVRMKMFLTDKVGGGKCMGVFPFAEHFSMF